MMLDPEAETFDDAGTELTVNLLRDADMAPSAAPSFVHVKEADRPPAPATSADGSRNSNNKNRTTGPADDKARKNHEGGNPEEDCETGGSAGRERGQMLSPPPTPPGGSRNNRGQVGGFVVLWSVVCCLLFFPYWTWGIDSPCRLAWRLPRSTTCPAGLSSSFLPRMRRRREACASILCVKFAVARSGELLVDVPVPPALGCR
jgi:hypothetical protein